MPRVLLLLPTTSYRTDAFLEAATDTAGRVRANSVVRGGSAEPLGPVPGTEDPLPFVASLLEAEGVATVSRL